MHFCTPQATKLGQLALIANMFVFKRSCRGDVPVVSQWVKAGCGSVLTASQSLLKKAFCRTSHKPRLWNNNKSTPYAHFIKHCIIELMGEKLDLTGPVSCTLAKMQAHNLWSEETIMDEWRQQPRIGGAFVRVFAVFVHIDFRCCSLIRYLAEKAAPSEVFETELRFSSRHSDERLKRRASRQ